MRKLGSRRLDVRRCCERRGTRDLTIGEREGLRRPRREVNIRQQEREITQQAAACFARETACAATGASPLSGPTTLARSSAGCSTSTVRDTARERVACTRPAPGRTRCRRPASRGFMGGAGARMPARCLAVAHPRHRLSADAYARAEPRGARPRRPRATAPGSRTSSPWPRGRTGCTGPDAGSRPALRPQRLLYCGGKPGGPSSEGSRRRDAPDRRWSQHCANAKDLCHAHARTRRHVR